MKNIKDTDQAKYHGTFKGSEIISISSEEIIKKFGKMFFIDDNDYLLWCREQVGGNEGIHTSYENKNIPTDPNSLRS